MTVEQACEIHVAMIRAVMPFCGVPFDGERTSLPDVSLAEMLEATRIIGEQPDERLPDGTRRMKVTADPRLIAAVYAHEHYGGIYGLIEALGYEFRQEQR